MQSLGALALRGERGALAISPGDQLRLKSNPFYAYVRERCWARSARAVPRPGRLTAHSAQRGIDQV